MDDAGPAPRAPRGIDDRRHRGVLGKLSGARSATHTEVFQRAPESAEFVSLEMGHHDHRIRMGDLVPDRHLPEDLPAIGARTALSPRSPSAMTRGAPATAQAKPFMIAVFKSSTALLRVPI